MSTMQRFPIPTGYLFTDEYSKGRLETLSIGDYGKPHNVKARFLGYERDLNGVANGWCMPLSEKWVVTLSTQYGCPMRCSFCDVPKVHFRGNATEDDLRRQLYSAIGLFPSVKYTERLNIHFARMGDPIFNESVFAFSRWLCANKALIRDETGLRVEVIHPVLTTSCPRKFAGLRDRLLEWCSIKNCVFNGQAGLQLSINSTDEDQRSAMYNGMQTPLSDIAKIASDFPTPLSRKYCLNFALADGFETDGRALAALFDPEKFMVKITPIHNNNASREHGLQTLDGYMDFAPYRKAEESMLAAGYDVLVFVPSIDEEDGLVTCGNAVLGGSAIRNTKSAIKIHGISA